MRNVTPEQVAMAEQHRRGELPDRIEGALGELAGAAKEGLMALSVGVGLGVLHELMAAEVDEVVGPNGAGKSTTTQRAEKKGWGSGPRPFYLPLFTQRPVETVW
jgi:hypothetical protein